MRNLNIALLQADLHWQNPQANRLAFAGMIERQAANADLIVLPEMFTTGFTMDTEANSETLDGETAKWLKKMALAHDVAICGSLIIREGNDFYNRLLWVGSDGSIHSYDKRHLFRMADEGRYFRAGDKRLIVEFRGWRICPLICYDLRFPVWSRGINEFDLLVYVANWPASRQSAWASLLPARAVENQCYVAAVNRVGTDGKGVDYDGGSLVADYLGNPVASGDGQPGVISAMLSLDRLDRYREKFPAWRDADRFTLDLG